MCQKAVVNADDPYAQEIIAEKARLAEERKRQQQIALEQALEEKIAMLENAEAGVAFGSGMGAISSSIWVNVEQGAHIVAGSVLYGCTFALLSHGLTKFGVETDFVDMSDPENVRKALKPNTKVVYLETPANPSLQLADSINWMISD